MSFSMPIRYGSTLMKIQSGQKIPLKGPKLEIFVAQFFTQSKPV